MKKYKSIVLSIQLFCVILLIMSTYLERSLTQLAYCFVVFSSPFLLFSFGEEVRFSAKENWAASAILAVETALSLLFVGGSIYGMTMGEEEFHGFGRLLLCYCVAAVIPMAECLTMKKGWDMKEKQVRF